MPRAKYWLTRLIGLLLLYSVGHGVLIWLGTIGIHPEQWIASLIGYATTSEAAVWLWWTLPAVVGLIVLGVWELNSQSQFSARAVSRNAKRIPARNVREVVRLISPGANIDFDFSEGLISRAFPDAGSFTSWETVHDGKELLVHNVPELGLHGSRSRILAEPRYAWVLNFRDCRSLSLRNLVIGHTEPGYCQGGVLRFENCSDVIIEKCELFGSGTYALELQDCDNFEICDSLIRDCTYGIGNFRNISAVTFRNCDFRDNRQFDLLNFAGAANKVMFKSCNFRGNHSSGYLFNFSALNARHSIYLNDSTVVGNTFVGLADIRLSQNNNKIYDNKTPSLRPL